MLLLRNGKVQGEPVVYKKRRIAAQGVMLAGPGAFVTYPEEYSFDQTPKLFLHRILNASLADNETEVVVSELTIQDGFRSFRTQYEYETSTAVFDFSGRVIQYPQVAVTPLAHDGDECGKTLYQFHTGLPAVRNKDGNFGDYYIRSPRK